MKKSFVLYLDQYEPIKDLSDEQKGQLLDAMFLYHNGVVFDICDPFVKMAFSFFRETFKRDLDKYLKRCDKNRANVRKRWNTKDTNVNKRIQPDTKHTDSDSDTIVTVIEDSDSDTIVTVHPFEIHLVEKITKENLFIYQKKITEFYNYRMAMKKREQYQTEKGINGLIRNVLELKDSSLDVIDSLEYAMEKNWKSPDIKYFNTGSSGGKQKTFDDFVNDGFNKNKEKIYVI